MRPLLPKALVFTIQLLLVLAAAPLARAFDAGAARIDITPPLGTPMLGLPDRVGHGATSLHTPLYSRALYLSDGETPVLLVVVDLYEIPAALRERVLALAPAEVPRDNIFLVATGTHSGPGAMEPSLAGRQRAGRFIESVLSTTANGIAESMRQAYGARQRGAIGHALANQTTLFKSIAGGPPVDEQVGVLRVDDADGNPIAIVANGGVRADWMASLDPYAFSSDLPGLFCEELEKLTPAGCIGFFLNGASADQTLANPDNLSGWEQAVSVAKVLAVFAKGAANQVGGTEAVLSVRSDSVTLPPALGAATTSREVILQHLQIGNAAISFLPGSPSVRTVAAIRTRLAAVGYNTQFCAGLANANGGALLMPADLADGAAPGVPAPLGPDGGPWAVRAAESLVTRTIPEGDADMVPPNQAALADGVPFDAAGAPYSLGIQWGATHAAQFSTEWKKARRHLSTPDLPAPSRSEWWPRILDDSDLRLEAHATRARHGLSALPPHGIDFIAGAAEGAGLPFDAVWLAWNARVLVPEAEWNRRPCDALTLAVLGDQAGADDALLAQVIAGDREAPITTAVFRPTGGQPVLLLLEAGGAMLYAGVNGAGVSLGVDRFPERDATHPQRHLAGLQLRSILETSKTLAEARAALRGLADLRGYRLLLCGPDNGGFGAIYVEPGTEDRASAADSGILLANAALDAAESWDADPAAKVSEVLGAERIIDVAELKNYMTSTESGFGPSWARQRIAMVVIAPKRGTLHLALQGEDGSDPVWVPVRLAEGAGQ